MAGAELRVLGPLQLSVDGREVGLGTPMQRAVLGRLIVAHGQVVSTERLIYDLWSGHPPPKAAAVLQVHIHTLRRLFEPQRARRAPSRFIVSESSGYALKMPENAVDAWHFEQQLRTYQELVGNPDIRTDAAERNALLEAALSLWHGPALEAFAEADWALAEADRLTDLYLTAVELNARTELELGRSGAVVHELRQLFEDHPGREEIVRLLALAQYQLGQQLEALTTIRRSREFLSTHFGVDPSPALRHLELAILNHSATLTATPPLAPIPATNEPAGTTGTSVRSDPTAAQPPSAAGDPGPAGKSGASAGPQAESAAAPAQGYPAAGSTADHTGITGADAVVGGTTAVGLPPAETPCATGYIAELSELLTTAESARSGHLRLAWVSGEAGIGKTVLTEATLSALATAGWQVAIGTCPEIDGAPMAWAWTEILTTLDAAHSAPAPPKAGHSAPPGTGRGEASGIGRATPAYAIGPRPPGAFGAGPETAPEPSSAGARADIPNAGAAAVSVADTAQPDPFSADRAVALGVRGAGGRADLSSAVSPIAVDLGYPTGLHPLGAGQSVTSGAEGASAPAADVFGMARVIAEKCRRAAGFGPVALAVENAHRADAATLQVLRQVAGWLRDEAVFVLVTMRRSESGAGIHNTVAALTQFSGAWIELNGLDAAATRDIALAAGVGEIDDERLARLHERTGGNPLFVREMAKLLATQGSLDEVPNSVRELIEDRVGQLPAGVTEVLRTVAVWGDDVDLALVSAATGFAEDTVIDLVTAAEEAGLVGSGSGGSIRFEHGLIRDAVYTSIPALRRGRMHWAALELLEREAEAFPAVARDPEVLARHAARGATAETAARAIAYVERAAELRSRGGTRSASVRLLRSAVELHRLARHDADHAPVADRVALLRTRCALVTALAYDNQHREARAERDRALTLAERLGDPDLVVRALTCWRAPVIWAIRNWREPDRHARRALSRALARYGVHPSVLALLETAGIGTAAIDHRSPAWRDAEIIAARDDSSDAANGDLVLLLVAATFETGLVEFSAGHRLAAEALAIARRTGDPELLCAAINAVTYLAFDFGAEFSELVTELEAVATAAGLAEYRALAHYLGYRAALAQADLREAGRRAAAAVEFADEGQLQPLLDMVGCFAATTELLRGDIDRADRCYEQFTTRMRRSGVANHAEAELFCALSLGWARGDLGGLLDRLTDAYAALPAVAAPAYTLALLRTGQRERARVIYENSDPIAAGFHPVLMAALRAVAAIELGDTPAISRLYEYLAPHGGTLIGVETGMTEFGPMDSILAALAEASGDADTAAAHRDRAERLLERIRAELPAPLAGYVGSR